MIFKHFRKGLRNKHPHKYENNKQQTKTATHYVSAKTDRADNTVTNPEDRIAGAESLTTDRRGEPLFKPVDDGEDGASAGYGDSEGGLNIDDIEKFPMLEITLSFRVSPTTKWMHYFLTSKKG